MTNQPQLTRQCRLCRQVLIQFTCWFIDWGLVWRRSAAVTDRMGLNVDMLLPASRPARATRCPYKYQKSLSV